MLARIRKKRISWVPIIGIIAVCFLFFSAASGVCAKEWSGGVPIVYEKAMSDAYPLSVQVSGPGALKIGNDSLREGSRNYLLVVDETKTVELNPDNGASIKKVLLNGKNIASEIRENQLTVSGIEKGQSLVVEFHKMYDTGEKPKTGDMADINLYLILLTLSAAGLMYLYCLGKTGGQQSAKKEKDAKDETE